MEQRTRTGMAAEGTGHRARKGIRAGLTAGLAAVVLATVGGCAFGMPAVETPSNWPTASFSPSSSDNPYDPTPSSSPSDDYSYSPSPTEETFDPDGRDDVHGSSCDFSPSRRQFT